MSAAVWQLLGADAESAAIEAFYAAELAARGWTVDPGSSSGFPATDEMTARVWSKDRVTFRLGIRDPEHWRSDPDLFSRYRSIYDARLIGDRQ